MGIVSIVGAGPGDPGLVTVKGMERIRSCDVLLYDHLGCAGLLPCARKDCVLIDTGKRAGGRSMRQEEINRLLIEYAGRYNQVVRLKGGDPFVFARGCEECMALKEAGISYEVIPGITSAVAAAECAGIPLTHRGLSRSFHVVTAHRKEDEPVREETYRLLAAEEGTLVFLMGVSRLEEICAALIRYGRDPGEPAAVVENGSMPGQRRIDGSISDIAVKARESGIASPAVLIVGDVCSFNFLQGAGESPAPVRIYAVGTPDTVKKLSRSAAERGMEVIPLITLETLLTDEYAALCRSVSAIESFGWTAFLSRQAVRVFRKALLESGTDIRRLSGCLFAANSASTAEALSSIGIKADFVAASPGSQAFAEEFRTFLRGADCSCALRAEPYGGRSGISCEGFGTPEYMPGKSVILVPRALRGSGRFEEILAGGGYAVKSIRAYDVGPAGEPVPGREDFSRDCADEESNAGNRPHPAIAFLSSSGADAFADFLKETGLLFPGNFRYFCMGEKTRDTLLFRHAGSRGCCGGPGDDAGMLKVDVPAVPTMDGLLDGIAEWACRSCNK